MALALPLPRSDNDLVTALSSPPPRDFTPVAPPTGATKNIGGVTWTFDGTNWTDGKGGAKSDAQLTGEAQNAARNGASLAGIQAANEANANSFVPGLEGLTPEQRAVAMNIGKQAVDYTGAAAGKATNTIQGAFGARTPVPAAGGTTGLGVGTPIFTAPGASTRATATLTGPIERVGNQAPITAQEIQAAQIAQYQAAQGIGPIQAGVSTAGQSQAAQIASTNLAQKQAAINAERISAAMAAAPDKIGAERVAAAQAGRTVLGPTALSDYTQLGPTAYADQTDIDMAKQAEFREGQQGLISGLQGAIEGKDPSVAAIMLRQQSDRNIANQFALAQSARGGNVGMAQRNAAINAANIGQTLAGQQALLRAQEITAARGQMGSVLDSARGSDVTLATQQAQLAQQVKLANAGFTNTANMTQAQLTQAVNLANAGFKNTANTTQAQLDQETAHLNVTQQNSVALANAGNQLDAAKSNLAAAQQTALANQSAENVARLENAKNALTAAQKNAELAQAVDLSNRDALNTTAQKNADLANASGIANASNIRASNQTSSNQTSANNTTGIQNAETARANALNQSNVNIKQADLNQGANTTNVANNLRAQESTATNNQAVALANALAANTAENRNADRSTQVSTSNAGNQVQTNAQGITSTQNAASNALRQKEIDIQAAAEKRHADELAWNQKVQVGQALAKGVSTGKEAHSTYTGGLKGSNLSPGAGVGDANGNDPSYGPDIGANPLGPGTTDPSGGTNPGTTGSDPNGGFDPYEESDRRAKKNVRRSDAEISRLLGNIKPSSFQYKNPNAPGAAPGRRFGVMAQDLEKSKAGKSIVRDTPQGKMVDTGQALLTALAALGNLNKRLKSVEKKRAA